MSEHVSGPAPWEDPIVEEVRRARNELFAEANNDLATLCERLRKEQELSGHPVVRRGPRPVGEVPGEAA